MRPTREPSARCSLRRVLRKEQLRRRLQTDVEITLSGKDKGAIRIAFYSADDLERLLDLVLGATREPL